MKAIMNKNVIHNGKSYDKGSEINKGDDGYEMLVNAGHASFLPPEKDLGSMSEESGSEEQSEQSGKSGKKSKK